MEQKEIKQGKWYSYKTLNGTAYLFVSEVYEYSSGPMGNRFLDPNWHSEDPDKLYNLGVESLNLKPVKDFNRFKRTMFKSGYITYEKEYECNYRCPDRILLHKSQLNRNPELVVIELKSGYRFIRFLKDFDPKIGSITYYDSRGILSTEHWDIKMIHIVVDPTALKEVIPKMFTYYREKWGFDQQYIAFDPARKKYINKTQLPEGVFVYGLEGSDRVKFVFERESGHFRYDYNEFTDIWYHSDYETHYILGFNGHINFDNKKRSNGNRVYDLNTDDFISVDELTKGSEVMFIDKKEMCTVKSVIDKVTSTTLTIRNKTYYFNSISNIVKLK